MANYNAPTEDITEFNTSLFNQPEVILSQAEADLLYLSKSKNYFSTASLTTFNGQVNVGGTLEMVSGTTTNDLAISGANLPNLLISASNPSILNRIWSAIRNTLIFRKI